MGEDTVVYFGIFVWLHVNCFRIFKIIIHAAVNVRHGEPFRASITPTLPASMLVEIRTYFGNLVHAESGRANNPEHATYSIGSVAYQQENFNLAVQINKPGR